MARGYSVAADAVPVTQDGVSTALIWSEFQDVLDRYRKGTDPLVNLISSRTTDPSVFVPLTNDGSEFELQSEFGVPESIRSNPQFERHGLTLRFWDLGERYTRWFARQATAEQIRDLHNQAMGAADRLVFKAMMRALLTRTTPSTRPQNENGTSVFSLFDGGADSNPIDYAGRSFAGGHSHYGTTGSTTLSPAAVSALVTNVAEHGFGRGLSETLVLLANPAQADVIRGFRVASGAPADFIPSQGSAAYLSSQQIVGAPVAAEFQNLPVIGSYGDALAISSDYIPANYVVCVAVTPDADRAALGYREHAVAQYRGLQLLPGSLPTAQLIDSRYEIGFGTGVRNRGAAAVLQVTASSTYASPTIA